MKGYIDYTKYQNKDAIIDSYGKNYTYEDLLSNIRYLQQYLKPGLVFCFCKNTIGSLVGYITFLESEVVPVMIDVEKDDDLISTLIDIYTPNYLWLPDELTEKYAEKGEFLISVSGYSLLHHNKAALFISKELALLLPTSGSTGSPKLVRLSNKNLISNAESIAEYLNITLDERPITSLPMHYSYGLSVINSHLIKGATLLLTELSVIQKEFWNFAKEQGATSISGVPYTYEMLRRLRIFNMELPKLKTLTQAGGKLNPNLVKEYLEQAHEHNKKFIVMYGQTEATARMSYLPFERALEKYSSIGIAIPGGKFKLIDENKNEIIASDVDGELVYCGPNVSLGYAECLEDLAKTDENRSVLHTGDIARRDEDGFYYITGRMKRFVKIYGNRVNLDATEQLLKSITTSCACVGVDDHLTVFTTEPDKHEDIKAQLVKKTGLNGRAFTIKHINNIPKNSSGKIQYSELLKLLQ